MWREIKPDRQHIITDGGYRAAAYEFGTGDGAALHNPGAIKRPSLENTAADLPYLIGELHHQRGDRG